MLRVIQARAESWAAMERGAASVVARSTFDIIIIIIMMRVVVIVSIWL